jgi:hypothetical protein
MTRSEHRGEAVVKCCYNKACRRELPMVGIKSKAAAHVRLKPV